MESPMKLALRDNKDFWAGMMLIGFGAGAMIIAREYAFGTTLRMGPGYFPRVLGGLLILFGIYILVVGLRRKEKLQGRYSLRALVLLPLSLVLFGALVDHAGFIPALVVLVFGSAAAGREFKFLEVLLLTVILTGLSVATFIWGLELPYPLIKGF
jgi:putative tricarboxylic transport membrane protein